MSKEEFEQLQAEGVFSPTATYERYLEMRRRQEERSARELAAMDPGDRAALDLLYTSKENLDDAQPQPIAA